jgi:K+-sensing histidine kinase KdpD
MDVDLRRLIIRHRNVAPMISALLAGTDAKIRILDSEDRVILDRDSANAPGGISQRVPINADREVVGWVEGGRVATAIAAVLSYACAREADKRSLSQEALERYRELSLIYDLAERIGATLEIGAVAEVAVDEVSRLPGGGRGFLLLHEDGRLVHPPNLEPGPLAAASAREGILGAVTRGEPEIINDIAADERATAGERAFASIIVAPLKVRGERVGVIGAVSESPVEYRAADLKVLAAVAALAGPAIDQSRQHERTLRPATGA